MAILVNIVAIRKTFKSVRRLKLASAVEEHLFAAMFYRTERDSRSFARHAVTGIIRIAGHTTPTRTGTY